MKEINLNDVPVSLSRLSELRTGLSLEKSKLDKEKKEYYKLILAVSLSGLIITLGANLIAPYESFIDLMFIISILGLSFLIGATPRSKMNESDSAWSIPFMLGCVLVSLFLFFLQGYFHFSINLIITLLAVFVHWKLFVFTKNYDELDEEIRSLNEAYDGHEAELEKVLNLTVVKEYIEKLDRKVTNQELIAIFEYADKEIARKRKEKQERSVYPHLSH